MAGLGASDPADGSEDVALARAARRFATEVIAPMVGTEGRDGDLDELHGVLDRAADVGLIARPRPDAADDDYGVWGMACQGSRSSLLILEELAHACAGVAACVHFAGLGAAAAGSAADARRAAVVACPPRWAAIPQLRAETEDRLVARDGRLEGKARFVWSAPGTDLLVVLAAGENGLERFAVEPEDPGLAPVGGRMGLAACLTHDVVASSVAGVSLGPAHAQAHVVRNWLGICAVSVGNARGALAAAHRYAAERTQGGAPIASHAAVQLLLGEAEARIVTSRAALHSVGARQEPDLRHAAMLALRVTRDCADAVSDCLQVLGGYGYMEDYRQEKRLRDALTLRSMGGRRADLARRLARTFVGGAS